ncbi:MBL fold hydrolase [Desulfosarcina alkanivorans]|uniref:MBL fold hydrolase n=1 Tax=Desulfosarcina alkanivorans TaxID=571177 RepID=A0A5K7YFX9_9BACT|nr:MBL fold metallo-hydrolase [Desulfosarcina alkanivorans]BBO67483.1 MBL fold hydrolase [Desulfosarcina alkanivorans]
MIVDRIGKIDRGVYMVGHRAMPVFLVDGDRPALFDAGLAFLGPEYVRQVQRILGNRQPAWCFLTHSHFDHCGAVAYLKARFPRMKVVCSQKAARVFGRPNAISLISDLNRFAAGLAADLGVDPGNTDFEPFHVDVTAGEGDRFEISTDVFVRVMETPGHTWDFLSYSIPRRKLLVPSEALGTPDESGYIVTDCLVDYDVHYQSMERLAELDVETLCLGHIYACTGSDARRHMTESLAQSRRFFKMVTTLLEAEAGNIPAVMKRVKAYEWDGKAGLRQPEPAYVLNLEARVNTVFRKWQASRTPDQSPIYAKTAT